MTEQRFLKIRDLTVQYSSGGQIIKAVNGVNLDLDEGKTLALVGETGAGKTTIAKSILQILPQPQSRINSGTIELNGEDMITASEERLREIRGSEIAMIFQDPMTSLNPVMTVGDQIAEVIEHHQEKSDKSPIDRAREMLELVGIPGDRIKEYPHQFSGGMKQRVVIAMALACNPKLLLADEPTSALDVTIQAQVLEMIEKLREQFNTSMVLITHDLGIVAEAADTVAIVYAGEVLEYGTKEQIFHRPHHPYTKGLFGAIPNLYVKARRLHNIEGLPPDPTNLPVGCCFAPRCPYAREECQTTKFEAHEVEPGHLCSCAFAEHLED